MDNLPIEITRKIYEYDSTYREIFNRVLIQLKCHFFFTTAMNVIKLGINAIVIVKYVKHILDFAIRYTLITKILMKIICLILFSLVFD